ncbi:GNAT family N-acetyltransferase [Rufibacter psychrotolerans]|uniref:GNAT family N-acetyltransferase n=1 Tax=Rufibacter psychrotolerans TaxID=2812556 RepID=UPI0019684926|nr:GNAT family protein [Rufibacter sp. SYSU D00308]
MHTVQAVTLRRLTFQDEVSLAQLANNKKVWENLRDYFPHPYAVEHAHQFIRLVQEENPPLTFAITCHDQLCGVISLVRQTDVYRFTAEIGYWLGEPFWHQGIAPRAVQLITAYGFQELGLARIYAGIFEYNAASMRVLEKCGYQKEGIFKKAIFKNGKFWNEHRYAIVQG